MGQNHLFILLLVYMTASLRRDSVIGLMQLIRLFSEAELTFGRCFATAKLFATVDTPPKSTCQEYPNFVSLLNLHLSVPCPSKKNIQFSDMIFSTCWHLHYLSKFTNLDKYFFSTNAIYISVNAIEFFLIY